MPRGTPDYGNPDYVSSSTNVDFSTLLMALAGVTPIGGTGRFMVFETFGNGLGGWTLGAFHSISPFLSVSPFEVGPVSLALPGANGAFISISDAERGFGIAGFGRYGFEFSFYNEGGANSIQLVVFAAYNSIQYQGSVALNLANQEVTIDGPVSSPVVTHFPRSVGVQTWLSIKLILDFTTGKYARLYVGDAVFDLTLDMSTDEADADAGFLYFTLRNEDDTMSGNDIYIGHIIITADEP